MSDQIPRITDGKTECFLVCDESLKSIHAPFMDWLREEGFKFAGYHGNYGCWWVYVNITRKQYAYGMPGIALVKPIGNHAITIQDFKQIYSVYKKYEGKDLFVFHSKRFDLDSED